MKVYTVIFYTDFAATNFFNIVGTSVSYEGAKGLIARDISNKINTVIITGQGIVIASSDDVTVPNATTSNIIQEYIPSNVADIHSRVDNFNRAIYNHSHFESRQWQGVGLPYNPYSKPEDVVWVGISINSPELYIVVETNM